ncbi:MAG: hypothetical protein IJ499_02100 [Clostridia bacterium]|nr:hypothetical protein [Clostridia bacterium]
MKRINKKAFSCPEYAQPLNVLTAILMSAIAGVTAGIFPSNYGGIFFLCISIGLLGYVLTVSFNVLYVVFSAAVSVGVAMLIGVNFPIALAALAFVPASVVLSNCVRKRKFLTPTVAAETVALISFAAIFALFLYILMGEEFTSTVSGVFTEYKAYAEATLNKANSMYPIEKAIPIDDLNEMVTIMMMLLPSIAILLCMLVCYCAAKVLRLAASLCSNDSLFRGGIWPLSVSVHSSIAFFLTFIVSIFSGGRGVVFYSALTFAVILLPVQAIVGFKLLFGKRGFMRNGSFTFGKVFLLVAFVYFLITNPIMTVILAAMFTVYCNIKLLILEKLKKSAE